MKRRAGTWELVHWGQNGLLVDRSEWKRLLGNSPQRMMTIREDGSLGGEANDGRRCWYVLDPTARPKTLDYFCSSKRRESLASVGIYELADDEWVVCYAAAVHPRPTDFTFKRGNQHIYKVYRRVKDKK